MIWTDIQLIINKKDEMLCEGISYAVCPKGVYIEDYSDLEQEVMNIARIDLIDEELLNKDREKIIIHHYISPQRSLKEAMDLLTGELDILNIEYEIKTQTVNQDDWENSWKAHYKPIKIGNRLLVCPSWIDYKTDRITLKLDPGMAFGSGTHETTYLCLEALDECIKGSERVLDVGTGSGILSIASLLLGAKSALGIDIDPTAVKVACENATLNNVKDSFDIKIGDLTKNTQGEYDIILANIVANSVIELANAIPTLLSENGLFISSGIITQRKDDVLSAFSTIGLKTTAIIEKNGWVCIVATK